MFLGKTINKTKSFFHKTFQNIKSFLFRGYQKLPKSQPLIPFSVSTTNNQQMHHLDNFYREFSEHWESDSNKVLQRKKKSTISKGNFVDDERESAVKKTQEGIRREEDNKIVNYPCSKSTNGGEGLVLAEKMKELEMVDLNDLDHVLDIEEIIHYYSQLTCPVYLDLVDTFFMEIYSEFILPHQPASTVQ